MSFETPAAKRLKFQHIPSELNANSTMFDYIHSLKPQSDLELCLPFEEELKSVTTLFDEVKVRDPLSSS